MRLPSTVYTLLHRGQELAAEVPCTRPDWRAWVWVCPIMKSGKTYAQVQEERTRTRLASSYDDTIAHFQIRYVELSSWHLADEWVNDLDVAIKERPIVDKIFQVDDERALV